MADLSLPDGRTCRRAGLFPACEEAGILGALPGIVGSMQAMEVIKEILGIGDSLAGRLLMYDALATRFYETRLAWNPGQSAERAQSEITTLDAKLYRSIDIDRLGDRSDHYVIRRS